MHAISVKRRCTGSLHKCAFLFFNFMQKTFNLKFLFLFKFLLDCWRISLVLKADHGGLNHSDCRSTRNCRVLKMIKFETFTIEKSLWFNWLSGTSCFDSSFSGARWHCRWSDLESRKNLWDVKWIALLLIHCTDSWPSFQVSFVARAIYHPISQTRIRAYTNNWNNSRAGRVWT